MHAREPLERFGNKALIDDRAAIAVRPRAVGDLQRGHGFGANFDASVCRSLPHQSAAPGAARIAAGERRAGAAGFGKLAANRRAYGPGRLYRDGLDGRAGSDRVSAWQTVLARSDPDPTNLSRRTNRGA